MNRAQAAWCLGAALALMLAGCQDSRPGGGVAGRQKGAEDAERDVKAGVLKLKEYPPLPYSLEEINYIKLLKERCHVEHEVLSNPSGDKEKDKELRAEVEAYNSVMTAEIKKKYGADILDKLRKEAARR
jgi:hypothetical protein